MDAWILIGMMGAGKSTIGHLLAEQTGREFVDIDRLIEKRLGRPISQFFQHYGEEAFRDHETSIIKTLASGPTVVATGGGAILRQENWDHFHSIGKLIYLRSEPAELIRRLQTSKKKRPLLNTENWEATLIALLESRKEQYEQADIIINVDDSQQDEIVERVLGKLGEKA